VRNEIIALSFLLHHFIFFHHDSGDSMRDRLFCEPGLADFDGQDLGQHKPLGFRGKG
jgi:hypothetical protein